MAAHRVGDRVLAEQLLLQALESDPRDADALQLIGLLTAEKGDLAGAERLFRQSLASNDRQPHVHLNLSNLLTRRDRFLEALFHCDRALTITPNAFDALLKRGELLLALDRASEAEDPLRQAYRQRPASVAVVVALAESRNRLGRSGEAEALLRQALLGDPRNVFYNHNLGLLLCESQRFDEALPLLMTLVETAPEQPEVFITIGRCLVGLARLSEARNYFLKSIELAPLNYFAHDALNRLLWDSGQFGHIGKSYIFAKGRVPDSRISSKCRLKR